MLNLTILFLSLLFLSSCNHSTKNTRELNGDVKSSKEYLIKINSDLEFSKKDTLAITDKEYNEKNQITKLKEFSFITNETVEIYYIYDSNNNLQKEIVSTFPDSTQLVIQYNYKDSLLDNTYHESTTENYYFKQIQNFKYDSRKRKLKSTIHQLYIDLDSNDTILNTLEINDFNKKGLLSKFYYYDSIKPEKAFSVFYNYRDTILASVKEFSYDNLLKYTSSYKYKFDDYGNWIERKVIQNDSLKFLEIREIQYN